MTTYDFDKPIDALMACHRTILEHMASAEALAHDLLVGGGPTFETQVSEWEQIARYFRGELVAHTRDEDEGLFPLLTDLTEQRVERFHFDHRWINQNEQIFLSRYDALALDPARVDSARAREFALEALEIVRHYRRHIAVEEEQLFPVALKLLSPEAIARLSAAMREHHAAVTAEGAHSG